MADYEKKLDALIDALGFDVEEVVVSDSLYRDKVVEYKLTKRKAKKTNKSAEERLSEATAWMGQQ